MREIAPPEIRRYRPMNRPQTALILAAGAPPPSLIATYGRTCCAMLPIRGRPAIHRSLDYLAQLGIRRAILGVRQEENRLPDFLAHSFGRRIEISIERMTEDRGPGFTLLRCLEAWGTDPRGEESALVVLGDTLFQLPEPALELFADSFVLTGPVADAQRWCLAEVDARGHVSRLEDKPASNPAGLPALIGAYFLDPARTAIEALRKEVASGNPSLQLRHALQPYIDTHRLRAHTAADWIDCGNLDRYNEARRRTLPNREFNDLRIDPLRGTITKRSRNRAKFLNEINYYRLLPADLSIFFPRLVDFGLSADDTFLTLEYYGYPTLSEMWLFEGFEPAFWRRAFRKLQRIMACFAGYTAELSPGAARALYWHKTLDRIAEWSAQSTEFEALARQPGLALNGTELVGWPTLQPTLENRVRGLSTRREGTIIHGDFCLPNILFDPVNDLFKFIDPRGSFGEAGIYGDPRYDIAKLLHSLDGAYDCLIQDLFHIEGSGKTYHLDVFHPSNRAEVIAAFWDAFGEPFQPDEIRLIEGLLFVSMTPLHADSPRRQTALFLTGLRILNELLSHENLP